MNVGSERIEAPAREGRRTDVGGEMAGKQPLADCVLAGREAVPSENGRLAADALTSLAGHVAVLDRNGSILVVNEAWNRFAASNGIRDLTTIGPRTNYLDVCARAARAGARGRPPRTKASRPCGTGRRAEFELEYPATGRASRTGSR